MDFLFHGAGCTHDMFEKQVSAMPDEYNVLEETAGRF